MRLALLAAVGLLGAVPLSGCEYDEASAACYMLADNIGARIHACGGASSREDGASLVHQGWEGMGLYCDTSPTSIADERMLYDVCPGELEVFDCARLFNGEQPASCDQILYRSR